MAKEREQHAAVRGVNSVDHALRLITCLASHSSQCGMTVTEMTSNLGLPRPTVYRLLTNLQEHGWVAREEKRYRLTLQLLALAESAFSTTTMQAVCQPYLLQLSRATGETAHLAVWDGGKAGYIAKEEGVHAIRMTSHIGWRGPLHATAAGKAMLAWTDQTVADSILAHSLERYTDKTMVDGDSLLKELEQVRERGYAVDDEELLEGLVCVAAPILVRERLVGAVSISGPQSRRQSLLASIPQVCQAAEEIAAAYR